jgi:acetate kinase
LVVCHLGGGASATAVLDGRSVDTSMGLSPLEGLVMATRSGSVDPDLPLHLVLRHGLSAAEVEDALNHRGGLFALAGSADMREVEAAAARGEPAARAALDVHDHRLAAVVAGMAASLGGLDALVFTGGVGEGSARVRAAAAVRLAFLGVAVDDRTNRTAGGDRDISARGADVRTLVVESREDIVIARAVRRAVAGLEGDRP